MLQNSPKVSIGMPVYNGDKYIRDAIDSILEQSFENFELIISDNCSTDETSKICNEYLLKDRRIRYFRQNKNIGIISNFEFVLANSKGDYYMWAACDDIWSKDWVKELCFSLDNSTAGAAFGEVIPVNSVLKSYIHIARGQTFAFGANKLFRRIKFFLDYEGRGKANIFYGLFKREQITNLKFNKIKYDYSILYDLLSKFSFNSVKNIYLYKRDHIEAGSYNYSDKSGLIIKSVEKLIPLKMDLLSEYLSLSNRFEKLILIFLLPLKIMIAYYWIAVSLIKRIKNLNLASELKI